MLEAKINNFKSFGWKSLLVTTAAAMLVAAGTLTAVANKHNVQVGSDNNSVNNPFIQPQDSSQSGGGRDQSLQFADVLNGTKQDDLLIGRLGSDILMGDQGSDVIIGGTEHFNPANRDDAFGEGGKDIFLWSPGDGSDRFDGGKGTDAVVLGLMGEKDSNGDLFFGVSNDQQAGNVFINPITNLPVMDVTNSPGFCPIIDDSYSPDAASQLDDLGLDHLVQFVIRSEFNDGDSDGDNGLRVTLHLTNVEFLICASQQGGQTVVYDLSVSPPQKVSLGSIEKRKLRDKLENILVNMTMHN